MGALSGKVAVVTGASTPRGIGNETAKAFAKAGASLFLVAEGTEDQLANARRECQALGEPAAKVETGLYDLAVPGTAESMVARALELFGRVDVLVNNAGIRAPRRFGEYDRATYERVIRVNMDAPFFASQAVLPAMRRQGGGRIIHIASQLGGVVYDGTVVYSMAKAALISLTRSMAYELAKENILVNAISPGPTATGPVLERAKRDPALGAKRVAYIPAGRLGEPEEIAELALFLATAAPAFLQGANIIIDGGYVTH